MVEMRKIAMSQVALHKTRTDLWVVIHGMVYNVSDFVSEHPGGEEILLEHAGKCR